MVAGVGRISTSAVIVGRKRLSLRLISVAVAIGGAPGVIPVIGSFYTSGSARFALIVFGILWIDMQTICGICSYSSFRTTSILVSGAIATLMLLLAVVTIFEFGPLYLLPGSAIWYVICFRNR